ATTTLVVETIVSVCHVASSSVNTHAIRVCRFSGPGFPGSGSRFRLEQPFERHAKTAHEADDAARLRANVPADAIRRVVDAAHGRVDGLIDALGLRFHFRGHRLDVVENGVYA